MPGKYTAFKLPLVCGPLSALPGRKGPVWCPEGCCRRCLLNWRAKAKGRLTHSSPQMLAQDAGTWRARPCVQHLPVDGRMCRRGLADPTHAE